MAITRVSIDNPDLPRMRSLRKAIPPDDPVMKSDGTFRGDKAELEELFKALRRPIRETERLMKSKGLL